MNTYEQLKPLAEGVKLNAHTAINLRDKNSKLIIAQPGDWLTKDSDGNILSVSKTDPIPKPVDSEPAKEPETPVEPEATGEQTVS